MKGRRVTQQKPKQVMYRAPSNPSLNRRPTKEYRRHECSSKGTRADLHVVSYIRLVNKYCEQIPMLQLHVTKVRGTGKGKERKRGNPKRHQASPERVLGPDCLGCLRSPPPGSRWCSAVAHRRSAQEETGQRGTGGETTAYHVVSP